MANFRRPTRDQVSWVQSLGPSGLKDFFFTLVDHASGSRALPQLNWKEDMMKSGIIVYVLGGGEPPHHLEAGGDPGWTPPAGPTEVVVSRAGCLELDDAWHLLLDRGCDPIHLMVVLTQAEGLQPLYPVVRLTGVDRVLPEAPGHHRAGRVLH
jgi:hypothetical protein